jgi:hypothetical protein
MARYLSTVPNNLGFFNLGTVQSYPTGGTGPTAYGPTSYFGSDPLPENAGNSIYTAVDLGNFSSPFRSITITNSHGGLSRRQTTFYRLSLIAPRAIQFTQNYSQFAYTANTNKNTLVAFYKIAEGTKRVELPINNLGYVYKSTGLDYDSEDVDYSDYPVTRLDPGEYLFLITNDIRYLETTYSITLNIASIDWRYVYEGVDDALDFGLVTEALNTESVDFGLIRS